MLDGFRKLLVVLLVIDHLSRLRAHVYFNIDLSKPGSRTASVSLGLVSLCKHVPHIHCCAPCNKLNCAMPDVSCKLCSRVSQVPF